MDSRRPFCPAYLCAAPDPPSALTRTQPPTSTNALLLALFIRRASRRHPVILGGGVPVAPRVCDFIILLCSRCDGSHPFLDVPCMILPALTTGGRGVCQSQPLATLALGHDLCRVPLIDSAVLHLSNFIASLGTHDELRHRLPLLNF